MNRLDLIFLNATSFNGDISDWDVEMEVVFIAFHFTLLTVISVLG